MLENWWGEGEDLRSRKGYTRLLEAEAIDGHTPRLVPHQVGDGENTLLISNGGNFLNVQTKLNAGERRFSSDAWVHAPMSGHTVMVNGTDVAVFDGTLVRDTVFTGTDLPDRGWTGLVGFKERIFLWVDGEPDFWYTQTVGAIQGPVDRFPLSRLGNIRGGIANMASWTVDAGDGINDTLVIMTNEGEILLYQGIDPGNPADWAQVGRFSVPKIVGKDRSAVNYGSDLIIITQQGFLPLSQILSQAEAAAPKALSLAIQPAILSVTDGNQDWPHWQAILDPNGRMLVFNAPGKDDVPPFAPSDEPTQFVFSITTRRWFAFTGIKAVSWAAFDGRLWFADEDGGAFLFWEGENDDGAQIHLRSISSEVSLPRKPERQISRIKQVIGTEAGLEIEIMGQVLPDYAAIGCGVDFCQEIVATSECEGAAKGVTDDKILVDVSGRIFQFDVSMTNQGKEFRWIETEVYHSRQRKKGR